jgi:hypothetical protein
MVAKPPHSHASNITDAVQAFETVNVSQIPTTMGNGPELQKLVSVLADCNCYTIASIILKVECLETKHKTPLCYVRDETGPIVSSSTCEIESLFSVAVSQIPATASNGPNCKNHVYLGGMAHVHRNSYKSHRSH